MDTGRTGVSAPLTSLSDFCARLHAEVDRGEYLLAFILQQVTVWKPDEELGASLTMHLHGPLPLRFSATYLATYPFLSIRLQTTRSIPGTIPRACLPGGTAPYELQLPPEHNLRSVDQARAVTDSRPDLFDPITLG